MAFSLEDLKPLADLLLEKGVPLLANIAIPGIGGAVASAIVPSLAQAFGLSSDASPAEVAVAVQADPNAATKLATVQAEHSELLEFATKAIDANQAELVLEPSFLGRLYVGGWRPAMGWMGVITLGYQNFAALRGLQLLPFEIFATTMGVWTSLAGIRGVEMVKGVARLALSTASSVVKPLKKAH